VAAPTFDIQFTRRAVASLRSLTARQRTTALDGIERHLRHQPLVETRNRKRLRQPAFAMWELRLGILRIYYEVGNEPPVVTVIAVGIKRRDRVFVGTEATNDEL
jgi:mRNA-degrading endonuclease RelE of RelBE toxin-antitoxin system